MSITEEWIKKVWYICTVEYYSAVKKNQIMPFAETWMNLEMSILSEVRHKYRMISLRWNLIFKNDINEFIHKTETDSQILKTNLWLPKGKCRGEG